VKGYRPDKRAAEADTIDAVRSLLPTDEEDPTSPGVVENRE
jgi:hypothetical protein